MIQLELTHETVLLTQGYAQQLFFNPKWERWWRSQCWTRHLLSSSRNLKNRFRNYKFQYSRNLPVFFCQTLLYGGLFVKFRWSAMLYWSFVCIYVTSKINCKIFQNQQIDVKHLMRALVQTKQHYNKRLYGLNSRLFLVNFVTIETY